MEGEAAGTAALEKAIPDTVEVAVATVAVEAARPAMQRGRSPAPHKAPARVLASAGHNDAPAGCGSPRAECSDVQVEYTGGCDGKASAWADPFSPIGIAMLWKQGGAWAKGRVAGRPDGKVVVAVDSQAPADDSDVGALCRCGDASPAGPGK